MSYKNAFNEAFIEGPEKKSPIQEPVKEEEKVIEVKVDKEPQVQIKATKKKTEKLNEVSSSRNGLHPASDLMREGIPASTYAENPTRSTFGIHNYDIDDFLTDFSKKNQRRGGIPITKSHLIELIMDVVVYDMELSPMGFQSKEEVREFLQKRLK